MIIKTRSLMQPDLTANLRVLYFMNGPGFHPRPTISGGDIRVVKTASILGSRGIKIGVVTTNYFSMLIRQELPAQYHIISDPHGILKRLDVSRIGRIFSYLYLILRSFIKPTPTVQYDIIIASSDYLCDIIPAWLCKRRNHKTKMVVWVHHLVDTPTKRGGSSLFNFVVYSFQLLSLKFIARYADLILTYDSPEGEHVKQYLLRNLRSPDLRIARMRNGVDLTRISMTTEQEKKYAASFVAALRASKGIFDLAPIWKSIMSRCNKSDLKFVVVGGGHRDILRKLQAQIRESGLGENMLLVGNRPSSDVYVINKSSKIFISPSYEEGWGIAVGEALACGLPVVCYDLPAYRVFKQGIIKVPLGDINALAAKASEILMNEALRRKLSEEAVVAVSSLDWSNVATEDFNILNKLSRFNGS